MSSYLYTRDLAERIDELTAERVNFFKNNAPKKATKKTLAALADQWNRESSQGDELAALLGLKEELGLAWDNGETLIPESHFEDYAKSFAEDIGAISREEDWPSCHIDWKSAADSLRMDFSTVEYRGETYLYRG